MTFSSEPTAKKMSFQKEYAEPLEWIAKALRDLAFPFITSKCFYEDADAFDADEKKLMAEDKIPLRMCDSCDTIFVANRKTQRYCCDKCRRKGE